MSCREGVDEATGDGEDGAVKERSQRRSQRRVWGIEMCLLHQKGCGV